MSRIPPVRRAAYVMDDGAAPLIARYRAMPFPETWHSSLLQLWRYGREESAKYRTVPTRRMEGVLQALAPDLVVPSRPFQYEETQDGNWLYAPAGPPPPLPDDVFMTLTAMWLRNLRPEPEHLQTVERTLEDLEAHPPAWREVDVDLLGCDITAGGTAALAHRQYRLAAEHIARRIMALAPYEGGGEPLRFRAVPRAAYEKGAELVSQPRRWDDLESGSWWWSIYLNVSVQTVPFSAQPHIHLSLGTRRWATRRPGKDKPLYLPARQNTTVYLRPSIPWIPGAPPSERYALARLRWSRSEKRVVWLHGDPAGLLSRVNVRLPDPHELLSAPETWLEDNRQVQAMIVHGTKMGHHAVGAGLMPHQRSQIIEWAESALPDGLVRVPDLKRSNRGLAKVSNAPLSRFKGTAEEQDQAKETERARAATARREALALSQGNRQVDLRLLWQTTETRDAAINAVVDLLGLPVDVATRHPGGVVLSHDGIEASRREDPLLLVWGTPELTVRLRCLKLTGDCAGNLGVKNGRINPQGLPLAEAIQQRRARIADFLNSDQEALRAGGIEWARPSLAMIEIDRRKDFASVADDPKYALRLGSADAGVLTQFALVPKRTKQGAAKVKDLAFRVTEAWTDGLRQLGLRVWPQHTALGMVPDGLQFLGLWMVTRRRDSRTRETGHLPVAVLSTPVAEHPGMVRVMGWDKSADDERGAWISYPEFLLRLTKLAVVPEDIDPDAIWDGVTDEEPQTNAQGKARQGFREWVSIQEAKRQDTFHLLQNVLRSPEVRDTPTVLLTAAQNSRSYWPAIQDQAVVADRIRTGNAPMARLPRSLRLVRVRTNAERETPQWWATTREGVPNGLAAGLWVEPAQAPRDTATMAPDVRGPLSAERVFYSTAEKAVTAKDSAVSADRLTFRPILAGKRKGDLTIDTGKMAHNPSLLEIAVLGCHCDPPSLASGVDASSHRDDPETLAFVVHQLRQAPDYQDALLLPLPLHLAKQTEEYVLPTRADDQNEDDEAAEVVMVGEDHEQAELLLPT